MNYNILIGGAAGQGMETISSIFERILKRQSYEVYTVRDYMSRVRGGHNFIQVRFSDERLTSHWDVIDGIVALNVETIENHIARLNENGFIVCDEGIESEDERLIKLPLSTKASESGNIKTIGSVALGSVFKLIGIEPTEAESVLRSFFNEKVAEQNIKAIEAGSKLVLKKYDAVPRISSGQKIPGEVASKILINGNEAVALGALAAGCKFYSAYPMTPSTSIMNYLALKMDDAEIVVEQAEDEIAAINMAIGASYAGARSMTGTSGGGFSLMAEGLGLSGMMEIPLVIAEVQRPGPTTGFPTRTEQSDLRFVISASQGEFPRMVIALRNAEDAFYQTVRAFNIADKYQIPVILLSDQYLADTTVTIDPFDFDRIENERHIGKFESAKYKTYRRYEITPSGISPRLIPGQVPGTSVLVDSDEHDESGHITESAEIRNKMVQKRMRKLDLLKDELLEPLFIGEDNYDVLLLAWGSTSGSVEEALSMLNKDGAGRYGALIFGDIWPLPVKLLREKAGKAKKLINVEQNATGQLASLISETTGIFCDSAILKYDGRQMSSLWICNKVKEVMNND